MDLCKWYMLQVLQDSRRGNVEIRNGSTCSYSRLERSPTCSTCPLRSHSIDEISGIWLKSLFEWCKVSDSNSKSKILTTDLTSVGIAPPYPFKNYINLIFKIGELSAHHGRNQVTSLFWKLPIRLPCIFLTVASSLSLHWPRAFLILLSLATLAAVNSNIFSELCKYYTFKTKKHVI